MKWEPGVKDDNKVVRLWACSSCGWTERRQLLFSSCPHKMSANQSAERITLPVYPHNNNEQQNPNCTHTHTHTPIKTQWSPLNENKRIKFCLFSEHTVCIMPLSKGDKRASVCENYLSPFFMSISISVGAPLEWNFVNGAHSFHSSASRGNRGRNSSTLPLRVTAVLYPLGGRPHVWLHLLTS